MSGRLWIVAALLVTALAAAAALAGWQLRTHMEQAVRAEAEARFRAAQAAVEAASREELALRAGQLATDDALAAYIVDAMQSGVPGQAIDIASISDLLGERQGQLGLDAVGVIGSDGRWITGTRPWSDGGAHPGAHALFRAARERQGLVEGLVREGERWYLGSMQPIGRTGVIDAWVYAGLHIDEAWIGRIATLAPVSVRIVASEEGQLPGNFSATLFDESRARLEAAPEIRLAIDPLPYALLLALCCLLVGGLLVWLFQRAALVPASVAIDLLERAAAGDLHLRSPDWDHGLGGRFAMAFDRLLARARPD